MGGTTARWCASNRSCDHDRGYSIGTREARLNLGIEHHECALHCSEELGRGAPAERLFPLVYAELRALAHSWFERQPCTTLQPTAIVHEAFLRLATYNSRPWKDCKHFKAVAAKAMRQIMHDHARSRRAVKRGGNRQRVTLSEVVPTATDSPTVDMLDLDQALTELATLSPRQRTITELRFFGGLNVAEVANLMSLSERTVALEWKMARGWLLYRLGVGK